MKSSDEGMLSRKQFTHRASRFAQKRVWPYARYGRFARGNAWNTATAVQQSSAQALAKQYQSHDCDAREGPFGCNARKGLPQVRVELLRGDLGPTRNFSRMDSSNSSSDTRKVEVSRGSLAFLVASLVLSLVLVAFLLGRESARPVASQTPTTVSAAPVALAPSGEFSEEGVEESDSIKRLPSGYPTHYRSRTRAGSEVVATAQAPAQAAEPSEQSGQASVDSYPQAAPRAASAPAAKAPAAQAPPAAASAPQGSQPQPADPQKIEQTRRYLAQIDGALMATPALSDPNSFATQLLGQSMSGDTSGFDILLSEARGTLDKLNAIEPPAHCKEHHSLNAKQLRAGIALLEQVKNAAQGLDTAALSQLSMQGHAMQAEIARLQEIDSALRASVR